MTRSVKKPEGGTLGADLMGRPGKFLKGEGVALKQEHQSVRVSQALSIRGPFCLIAWLDGPIPPPTIKSTYLRLSQDGRDYAQSFGREGNIERWARSQTAHQQPTAHDDLWVAGRWWSIADSRGLVSLDGVRPELMSNLRERFVVKVWNIVKTAVDGRYLVFRQFQHDLLLPELVQCQVIIRRRLLRQSACIFLNPSVSTADAAVIAIDTITSTLLPHRTSTKEYWLSCSWAPPPHLAHIVA